MGAEFKVIKVDPDGSGMDYDGHLGMTVIDPKRCCRNCSIIFGTIGETQDFGPFVPGELEPLNDQARFLLNEIQADQPWAVFQEEPPSWLDGVVNFFRRFLTRQ